MNKREVKKTKYIQYYTWGVKYLSVGIFKFLKSCLVIKLESGKLRLEALGG